MDRLKDNRTGPNDQRGFSLAELILALALFGVFAGGATTLIVGAYSSTRQAELQTKAAYTEQEAFEAVDSIAGVTFNELQSGSYTLDDATGEWELSTDPVDPTDKFRSSVDIADVYRDGSGDMAETGTFDPHTRKITTDLEWDATDSRPLTVDANSYITDWSSSVLTETTEAEFSAGTSTNVMTSNEDDGEIRLEQATMEAGMVSGVDESWVTVYLEHEYDSPVIATVYHEENVNNRARSISTRIRNATSTSFQVRLQEASDVDPDLDVDPDDVYYLVVEEGAWTFGDDDTIIEAGLVDTSTVSSYFGGYTGERIAFDSSFPADPVVLHQVMSYDDSSWITTFTSQSGTRYNPPTSSGMWVSLHGAEVTTTHGEETIGWISIEANVTSTVDGVSFETFITPDEVAGHASPPYSWSYNYQSGTLTDPRVIMSQLAEDGGNGGWAVMVDISSTAVSVHIEEDQVNDAERWHTTENVGYFAVSGDFDAYLTDAGFSEPTMEVGSLTTETGTGITMEADKIESVSGADWTSVEFINTNFTDPVVVVTVLAQNNSGPISARLRSISSTGFEVILQAPDGSTPSDDAVVYMAVERGTWFIEGYKIEADSDYISTVGSSTVIGGTWAADSKTYSHTYTASPVVLHSLQSANDESWISSWVSRDGVQGNPPNRLGFQIAMNGAQVTTTHDPETIGWIVIEQGITGTISGVEFETMSTPDEVGGPDNSGCLYEYYDYISSADAITVSSQMEMDGSDGSWNTTCSQGSDYIGMYSDEDQEYDSERWHTTETHGFIAFADNVVASHDEGWTTVNLQNTYTSPVVVVTGYEQAFTGPVSARLKDVTSDSFQVMLQSSSGATGIEDDVHYIVVEEGAWKVGDTKIEAHAETISTVAASTVLGSTWIGDSKTYSHSYVSSPIVLHQVMSYNDEDWITTWVSRDGNRAQPPNASGFQIALNGAQVTTTHDPETVGWIVFKNVGTDEINGVEFRTAIPTTEMQGHDNGCYTDTHGGTYTDPIVVGAQLEMDGADGSWLRTCEITSTTVGFHAEEDQEYDSERSHTTEIYGYIVFAEEFDHQGAETTGGVYESIIFGPYSNYHILEWNEDDNGCTGCDIHVQIRTSDNYADLSGDITDWAGPTGVGTYYEDQTGYLINTDHLKHDYLQYRVVIEGDSGETPLFEDISFFYTP